MYVNFVEVFYNSGYVIILFYGFLYFIIFGVKVYCISIDVFDVILNWKVN